MVRAVQVAGAGGPGASPCKNRHKDQEKCAGDFEPENAAYAAEGAQESARAAGHGTTAQGLSGLAQRLSGLNRGAGCRLSGGAVAILDCGAGNRSGLMHLSGGRRLRVGCQMPPGSTPNHAYSDAQGAADYARSHTVYDGSSGLMRFRAFLSCSQTGLAVR